MYNKPDVGYENPKLFPGKLMTRDEQCTKIFGSGWTAEEVRKKAITFQNISNTRVYLFYLFVKILRQNISNDSISPM